MTDSQTLDAERIKQEAIEASKQALIESLQGGKKNQYSWQERGKEAPDSYPELFEEVKKQIPTLSKEDIALQVEETLRKKEEAKLEEDKKKQDSIQADLDNKRKAFDAEWYDLVQQGKMPKVAQDVQERINKGETLTLDEIEADEGLKARLELAKLAQTKSAKVAYYEDYNKEPAGSRAPVLGSRPSVAREPQELDYERDIKPLRKRMFGF